MTVPESAGHIERGEEQGEEQGSLFSLLFVLGVSAVGLLFLVGLYLVGDGTPGRYLVLTSPLGGRATGLEVASSADAAVIQYGGFDNILIVASDRPEAEALLHKAGAWMVLPAPRILGCGLSVDLGSS